MGGLRPPPDGFEYVLEETPLRVELTPRPEDIANNRVTFRASQEVRLVLRRIPSVDPDTLADHDDGDGVRGDG